MNKSQFLNFSIIERIMAVYGKSTVRDAVYSKSKVRMGYNILKNYWKMEIRRVGNTREVLRDYMKR